MLPFELPNSSDDDVKIRTEIHEYQNSSGTSPFEKWFAALNPLAAAKAIMALVRVASGNTCKVRSLGSGLAEVKVDFGPGYRVYFGRDGAALILLLGGSTRKRHGDDIAVARDRWHDYQTRKRGDKCHRAGTLKYLCAHADGGLRGALMQETANAFLSGEVAAGKAVLRDYIHATVGFDAVARAMRKSPKSLMRMLGPEGNPRASNLFAIFRFLQAKERIRLAVKAQPLK
jgi:putative addiction module killer protein